MSRVDSAGAATDALAPAMLDRARTKAAGLDVSFTEGDAADPPLPTGAYDVVLSRHVLWAMPDRPAEVMESVRGHGPRHAAGELVSCPFCLGLWGISHGTQGTQEG